MTGNHNFRRGKAIGHRLSRRCPMLDAAIGSIPQVIGFTGANQTSAEQDAGSVDVNHDIILGMAGAWIKQRQRS